MPVNNLNEGASFYQPIKRRFLQQSVMNLKIKNIQKDKQQIVIAPPQSKYAYKKGKRYHFLNILEELDRPGEYYIDRLNGVLYVYPYQDIKNSKVYVSILNKPKLSPFFKLPYFVSY